MVVDLFLVYQFIKRLATPFNKWKAYELGIIDEKGNILKRRKDLNTVKEREAWGKFDVMISKLKKLLEKVPGGSTRLASYAAALWLIKENENQRDGTVLQEEVLEKELLDIMESIKGDIDINILFEDSIANTAGSGAVAGIGVGKDGEPGLTKKQQKKYKKKNMMFKRFKDTVE